MVVLSSETCIFKKLLCQISTEKDEMYSIRNKRTLRKKSFYNFIAVQLTRSYGYVFNWFQYIPYIKLFLFWIFFHSILHLTKT